MEDSLQQKEDNRAKEFAEKEANLKKLEEQINQAKTTITEVIYSSRTL